MSPALLFLLALEPALIMVRDLWPQTFTFLPLGGTDLSQLGCILAAALAYEAFRRPPGGVL